MSEIRTLLIDDEPFGLTALEKLLQFNCPEVMIVGACSNAKQAMDMIREKQPDLIFLDIRMPGKSGIDLLREMPHRPFEVIFVTAYSEYMVQAFQFSAVDYLLKPVDEELLTAAVQRAKERIATKAGTPSMDALLYNMNMLRQPLKMKLCIPSIKGFQVVELNDILYCEASSSYTNFHFTNRPLICASKSIHEYETMLEDIHFVRVHKSYLVNIHYIREYVRGEGGVIILNNGMEIEVSRRKKEVLMSKMKEQYRF